MKIASASRSVRTAYAFAFVFATAACVKVTDDVKATFAPPAPGEADNFAVGAPHGRAPAEELTQATVPRANASVALGSSDAAMGPPLGMCTETAPPSSTDAGATSPALSNCLQDAGIR